MTSQLKLKGAVSALVTPFSGGAIDFASMTRLVEFQLKEGICGFVVNGTTAESPTLSWEEVEKLYSCVREISGSRVPVILGTGSNSTKQTIETTKKAEQLGADAALVVVPYYNKPPQRGLIAHFSEVAKSTSLPVILYNVPGRTITSMTAETILELSKIRNIVAIKEASGDIAFDEKVKALVNSDFTMLSGDDPTYIPFLKLGGSGIISVMSNAIAAPCARWISLSEQGKWEEAQADFDKYRQLISLMYVEANPIPIKWMLYKMGIISSPEMRLPLVELDKSHHEKISAELKITGMI
jgi:4-hydroxy-tetrahydrodipicolinate synthase